MNIMKLTIVVAAVATIQCSPSQAADQYPENDQISYLCKYKISLTEGTEEINTPPIEPSKEEASEE